MKKVGKILIAILFFFFVFFSFFFIGNPPQVKNIEWGVNFSQKHAQFLDLDWRETYLALLDDLKVKNIKIITHWDLLEPEKEKYFFDDLEWQIGEAEKRGAKIILVLGMKTGRWPVCHIPDWAKSLNKKEQQERVLKLIEKVVLNYRNRTSIKYWQVENEPLFPFGECPWIDKDFLKKEIDLVKSLDKRPVIISDSGEFSFWFKVAKLGDIVGTTLHRKAWFREMNTYVHYPFRPIYYWRRVQIIKVLFGKKVICVELQTEPWGPKLIYDLPLSEQEKTMNFNQFQKNIDFAKKTGLDTFYFWGAEWWYWLKEKQNQPAIWLEAKKLF